MDQHALEYYSAYSKKASQNHFHEVIFLNDHPDVKWSEALKLAPDLCKGWFELAHLPVQDRLEFVHDFWMSKFPYHPLLSDSLTHFFSHLDDIGIVLTQQKFDDSFESQLIYSLKKDEGFFHGGAPASDQEIINLQKVFPDYILPVDYLAFLQIHNGFSKFTDTGITKSVEMKGSYNEFQKMLEKEFPLSTSSGQPVNPNALIPFYKSFGMSFYQAFWGEWYPDQEMGNVYYSSSTKTISNSTKRNDCVETMAFETFTEWLMFYLEKIE